MIDRFTTKEYRGHRLVLSADEPGGPRWRVVDLLTGAELGTAPTLEEAEQLVDSSSHLFAFECFGCGLHYAAAPEHQNDPRCPGCDSRDRIWLQGSELREAAGVRHGDPSLARRGRVRAWKASLPLVTKSGGSGPSPLRS